MRPLLRFVVFAFCSRILNLTAYKTDRSAGHAMSLHEPTANMNSAHMFTSLPFLLFCSSPDDFEEVLPDLTNLSEYTYESLVFSFSLLGAMGALLADPKIDTIDEDALK
jgi:hypothetical protein